MLHILKKFFLFFLLLSGLIFTNCSKKENIIKKPEKIPPLTVLYNDAFSLFENGNWTESIEKFQKVETRYSFSEWAPRATLMIIYIYYEAGQHFQTLEYINKYKKLYPKNININYVDFIRAMTFYEQITITSRDQTYAVQAMKEFNQIIKKYPNSRYAEESKLKIDLVKEQLAGKEMYIARFYMKKSKWIAAIKRLKIIINDYDTTIYSEEALHRLVEIYYKLGNIKESKKYAAFLGYNFNDGTWYKKTYKIVGDRNYKLEQEKTKKKLRNRIIEIFKFSK